MIAQTALTVLGVVIIVLGLRDMYHSLLHPRGKGAMSHAVTAAMWKLSKRAGHRLGPTVGPAAMVTVVVLWVALQTLGWALIYIPHIPGGFVYSPGVDPTRYPDFVGALYISLVTLVTLGFGDVVAVDPWLRAATPLEALIGFALLTTALTWFTQVYPPLSRRRALALELKGLADSGYAQRLSGLDAPTAGTVLHTLASEIGKARVDLTQHTESYYFREEDPDLSLARQLSYALALREAAAASPSRDLQAAAEVLSRALEQLATKLRADFVRADEDVLETFKAYAADHARTPRI